MSGRRPDATRVWNFYQNFRLNGRGSDWTSLPQNFKINSYLTMGTGKTYVRSTLATRSSSITRTRGATTRSRTGLAAQAKPGILIGKTRPPITRGATTSAWRASRG